ncbi:MAG: DUF4349 domain-containing protein [Gaiellaceae bacterium]
MPDSLDALALELRATAPAAPARLRTRVDAIAARTPPAPASWRAWFQPRRALLVAAPTAVAAMLAVAIAHGLSSSPTHSDASQSAARNQLEVFSTDRRVIAPAQSGVGAPIPRASGTTAAKADRAANTPPPSKVRAQEYRAMLTVRLGSVDGMSDAMKNAIRATRAWGGYVVAANYNVPGANGDARLIVRIPVQHVQAAIQRFSDLGTLAAQDVSIRDVQATLDSYTRQLLATRERIAKLRVKLAHAETDAQRASLELQIARAQRAAAQLRAEQVALKRQASFANVTLTLTTRDAAAATPHKEGRIERTLRDAVSILALELVFALYGLIVVAPVALLAALAFLAARAGRRRADERLLGST